MDPETETSSGNRAPLSHGNVEYVDHMGSDLSIVNAARVSRGRWKTVFDEEDERLLAYLVRHEHMSPFRHAFVTLRVTCPILVERQWFKHQVGCSANSLSGRHVQYSLGYWVPEMLRREHSVGKHNLPEEPIERHEEALALYRETCDHVWSAYNRLINEYGVCKEQARAILGLNTYTQFVFSASLQAWFHFYRLRTSPQAQMEIRAYAYRVGEIIETLFPHAWTCLLTYGMARHG